MDRQLPLGSFGLEIIGIDMKNFVTETRNTIHIKILEDPIAGVFYIRDKYLKRAKLTGKKLVIEYNEKKYICTYKEWMKGAKRMEKIFLIPNQPMILWGQYIAKFKKKKEPEIVSNVMQSITSMPEKYRLQIKAQLGLI